jgi:Flp pilus assembly protein TadD
MAASAAAPREAQQARRGQDVQEALARAQVLRAQARAEAGDLGKWAEARAVARQARALAEGGPVAPGVVEGIDTLLRELTDEEKDRQMVARVEGILLPQAEVKDNLFDTGVADPRYAEAFRWYGVDVEALPVEEAARRVRGSAIRETLLAALHNWAWYKPADGAGRTKLWAVADSADDSPWRRRLRQAWQQKDPARLKQLAGDAQALQQPPPVLALLGEALHVAGLPEEAADFLRRAQRLHPADFWINHHLGFVLFGKLRQPAEARPYFQAALALRPGSAGVHSNLGVVLMGQGDLSGAAASFRKALDLDPKYFWAHLHLGVALFNQGDARGAVESYRGALALEPKDVRASYDLGNALWVLGDLPGAAASYRSALQLDPKHAEAHCNLGHILLRQGNFRAALAEYQTGHDLGARRKDWSYSSAQWVRGCERLLELEGRLPAFLKGEVQPTGPAERIDLGELCHCKGLHAASVRFFAEAFAADANLANNLRAGYRYRAACSAALIGCGQGKETGRSDDAERARLRRQALEWLRADLARWARQVDAGTLKDRGQLQALLHWQLDPALAGVRDRDPLGTLPAAERAAWQQLWADVAATLAKGRNLK